MKMISVGISLCLFPFSVGAMDASFSRTDLIDLNQKPIFRPKLSSFQSASAYKTAKVHFVVNSSDKMGFDYKEHEFNHDNINRCKALGFSKTGTCAAGQYAVRFCPYDNAYFSQCCDNTYAYSKAECSYPRTISSNSCGGKFKCYCDTSLYPHTSCPSPKEPADKCVDDTGTHYAECNCPSYYKPCTGNNMQGVGTGCNRDGEMVYAACECKSGYKYVCEEFGPTSPNDYCLNGIKYYTSCKNINNVCTEELKNKYPSYNVVQGECGQYEQQIDTCSKDGTFKVCKQTCKSRLANNKSYGIDSNGFIYSISSPSTVYVVENSQIVPLINSKTGSPYTNVYGPEALKYSADLCGSTERPTIKVNTSQSQYVLSRNFTGVNLELLSDSYHINSNAYWNNVVFRGKTYLTLNLDGSNAKTNIYSDFTSGRTINIYASNNAYVSMNENTTLSTVSLKSGAQLYVGGGGSNTISSLTVDGGGTKASLSYSKNLNISSASVTNSGVIQADDSVSTGRTYQIGTLRINSSGIFKTNYIKPFQITDLYMQERGRVKVGSMGQVRVSGTIYIKSCARMCTYSGSYKGQKGVFYYRNNIADCWPGTNSCAVFYASHTAWPMTDHNFNYAKCYTNKYLADRWLTRGNGIRGKEMCGDSYSNDTITKEHC